MSRQLELPRASFEREVGTRAQRKVECVTNIVGGLLPAPVGRPLFERRGKVTPRAEQAHGLRQFASDEKGPGIDAPVTWCLC